MNLRESLNKKYYVDWQPEHSAWILEKEQITDEYLIEMYQEYINKLNEFIDDINTIEKTVTKEDFKSNYRQVGGFKRCVTNYPDTGWKEKYQQYAQAYKEIMCDFIYYSPELEYDEISLHEIDIIRNMAKLMIQRAENYIEEINNKNTTNIEV